MTNDEAIREQAIEAAAKALHDAWYPHRINDYDSDPAIAVTFAHQVAPLVDAVLAVAGPAYRAELARAWGDGYNDAATMAHCYGHTDHWLPSDEPSNPYSADAEGADHA